MPLNRSQIQCNSESHKVVGMFKMRDTDTDTENRSHQKRSHITVAINP